MKADRLAADIVHGRILAVAFSVSGYRAGKDGARERRRPGGQARILQDLSWPVGPGLSRIFSDAAACGAATRIYRGSVAGLHRTQAGQPDHAQRRACAEPVDDHGAGPTLQNLNPPPFGGAPRGSIATGKKIYEDGLPESNVPACSACHGAEGKGQNEIPRLAGQVYPYMVGQLTGWKRSEARARRSIPPRSWRRRRTT